MLSLWLPVAGYMAGIFWLSSQSVLPGASMLPDWLNYDWLHHGTAYAGLAMVVVRALAGGRLRAVAHGEPRRRVDDRHRLRLHR